MIVNRNPKSWGRKLWTAIEIISVSYPLKSPLPEVKSEMSNFLRSFQTLLPCDQCRKEYASYLIDHPPESRLNTRDDLLKWVHECKTSIKKRNERKNAEEEKRKEIKKRINQFQQAKQLNNDIPPSTKFAERSVNKRAQITHPKRRNPRSNQNRKNLPSNKCKNCGKR